MSQSKLFVGQVPYDATEPELRSIFERCGTITELRILADRDGRSKGCALVACAFSHKPATHTLTDWL